MVDNDGFVLFLTTAITTVFVIKTAQDDNIKKTKNKRNDKNIN